MDIDGILANFTGAWNKVYPEISANPDSWYFDRNIVERFDDMRNDNKLNSFYLNIEPLIKPSDLPFVPDCYITSRPVSSEITEAWLDDNGFPTKPVYSINNGSKVQLAKDAGIDIFVDDSFDNFKELNNAGIFTYLYTAPWNLRYDVGHMRIDSLRDIPMFK